MTESYYNSCTALIATFSHRMMCGPALNESEAMAYEQLCRLIESTCRGLRLSAWDKLYPPTNTEES